jgi:hypothetical protein
MSTLSLPTSTAGNMLSIISGQIAEPNILYFAVAIIAIGLVVFWISTVTKNTPQKFLYDDDDEL